MALTTDEQELLDFALKALPPWMRADDEFLRGAAKLFGSVRSLTTYLLTQAKITTAEGATSTTPDWLMQHAKDRDTVRLAGESDATLRIRLRTFADALTRESILGVANEILVANSVTTPAQLIELPRDGIHFGSYTAPSGTGGAFLQAGTEQTFLPTDPPSFPPFQDATIFPPLTWRLAISGADETPNNSPGDVAATVATADLAGDAPGLATDGTIWTATLQWIPPGTAGNGKVLDVRTDSGAGSVEVRDNERNTGGGGWVAAPGTVGILILTDVGLPVTIGDIEAEIAASSTLVSVLAPDPSPSKVVDLSMDGTTITAVFAGGNTDRIITRLSDDAMVVSNPAGVADASDTGVAWAASRYDVDDNLRDGFARAYLGRGHRIARASPMLILILPYPTSASVASSIETAVKTKIAAGFSLIVETRAVA